jgi:NAD-dependent deacetylase
MATGFDLAFSIGTSSRFPYVVQPMLWLRSAGVPTVEINPDATELSRYVDFPLRMGAARAMEALWQALGELER